MNRRACALLVAGAWAISSFHATSLTTLTFQLSYRGSNEIGYFFCDIFPVVKLACSNTLIIEMVSLTNIGLEPRICFLYMRIVTAVVKIHAAEGWHKAASTCVSHLSVVTLFFGPCALVYTQPSLSKVLVTPVQIFASVISPMLNPTIYT